MQWKELDQSKVLQKKWNIIRMREKGEGKKHLGALNEGMFTPSLGT